MKKTISILSSILIVLSLLFYTEPFSISANQALPDPFVGVNVRAIDRDYVRYITSESVNISVEDFNLVCTTWQNSNACKAYAQSLSQDVTGTITVNTTSASYYLYEYEFILDNNYVGYVTLDTFGTIYVNGNSFVVSNTSNTITINITDYSLQVINSDHWSYPLESFNAIYYCFYRNFPLDSLISFNNYQFPIFDIVPGDNIIASRIGAGDTFRWVFFMNRNVTSSVIQSNFTLSNNNLAFENYRIVNRAVITTGGTTHLIVCVDIVNSSENTFNFYITFNGTQNAKYMPIYFNSINNDYVSTDFALNFGLSNRLLDSLDYLVQGTPAAAESVDNLDDSSNQFLTDSSDLMDQEDQYNQDFNNQLQNIDFSNPTANNPNFLSSAGFVIDIFDTLIAGNPLAIFIIIICIILIAKKVFGK